MAASVGQVFALLSTSFIFIVQLSGFHSFIRKELNIFKKKMGGGSIPVKIFIKSKKLYFPRKANRPTP